VAEERDFDERRTAMLTGNIVGHAQSILMKRFEVTAELCLPVGGPPLWRMWRVPRTPR